MRALPLVGYFPKRVMAPPPWLLEIGVREVASVSECISSGPDDWVQAWKHNALGFFDNPDLAWSVVSPDERSEFRLYAYGLYSSNFSDGLERPYEWALTDVTPLDASFESAGYDVVSRTGGGSFECSPLSCNHMAKEIETNAYCLLREFGEALTLALTAESRRCEPGPYFVLQVWRQ